MLLVKKILVFFSITLIKFIRLTLTLNKVNRSHSQRTFCEETRCALQTSGIWKNSRQKAKVLCITLYHSSLQKTF